MIEITSAIAIDEDELHEDFIRASGPGGQNVNKVSSAVQLRFNALASPNLPDELKQRLRGVAGRRLTADGVLIIEARRYRAQEQNRADARERLRHVLQQAAEKPKPRKATRPTLASKKRRLDSKTRRSSLKAGRGRVGPDT